MRVTICNVAKGEARNLMIHKRTNFLMDWVTSSDRNTNFAIAGVFVLSLVVLALGLTFFFW